MAKIMPLEDIEDFEDDDDHVVTKFHLKKPNKSIENVSLTSSNSDGSTINSSYGMKMGLYSINLSTRFGQRMHAAHMLILPLIPVFILIAQNGTNYATFILEADEIISVQKQVSNAVDLSNLVQQIQDERAAVALNIFLKRSSTDDLQDLQDMVTNDVDIRRFTLTQTFNQTDTVLQSIDAWPDIGWVDYFETKLKFQIQHSIFRTKIREGKSIFDVLNWYNEIVNFVLDYISLSIHDSDVSDFYRYIISFKNLLRSVEFTGKSGIYALRYLSQGFIEREHHHDFIRFEMLRKEYLNQTFNFMPELRIGYDEASKNQYYEFAQNIVTNQEVYVRVPNDTTRAAVDYFSQLFEYLSFSKAMVDGLTIDIEEFVAKELARFEGHKTIPLSLLISLTLFIPIVAYITLQATTSMFRFSEIYDERVKTYKKEKRQTEKLLTDLLPRQIIHQMKRGRIPEPESFLSVSIFLCDIVGFTNLASESTAHQIVDMLNSLYNLFDIRLENYDVYKVETIGDAYMVASGVPEENDHHAVELCKMALDLLAKVVTFEVPHKPGYRIKLRMGIHSGSCVAGVVGTKIPHYSVFGETVEKAGLMENTSRPMKIQITRCTMELLSKDGSFNYVEREELGKPESIANMTTFWLIGRSNSSGEPTTAAVYCEDTPVEPAVKVSPV